MALRVVASSTEHSIPYVVMKDNQKLDSVYSFLQKIQLRGMATETIRAYAYDLLDFYRFIEQHKLRLRAFNQTDFINYVLVHKNKASAPRTINRRLLVVRDFLNAQYGGKGDVLIRGLTQTTFYKGQKNKALIGAFRIKHHRRALQRRFSVKVPARILRPLTIDEIKRFLAALRTYRDQVIVYLMLFCGLRSCEVLRMEIDDIDFDQSKIIIKGKGQKERAIPLCPAVVRSLNHYLNYERPDVSHHRLITVLKGELCGQPLTYEGLRNVFRYWRKNTNLKKAHPHMFRHTFCSNLIAQGVSLPVVQKLMGHSDIETTMLYVHMGIDDVAREYYQALQSLQRKHEEAEPNH
jgi:integrase/recombinase XerD